MRYRRQIWLPHFALDPDAHTRKHRTGPETKKSGEIGRFFSLFCAILDDRVGQDARLTTFWELSPPIDTFTARVTHDAKWRAEKHARGRATI